MTVADDLEQARAALTMIHGEPFNAEAPPEALQGTSQRPSSTTSVATSWSPTTMERSRSAGRSNSRGR
jgi:hypothetical protein